MITMKYILPTDPLGFVVMMIMICRHANLVLHVRMKGALLGSVDLALQVEMISSGLTLSVSDTIIVISTVTIIITKLSLSSCSSLGDSGKPCL